MELLLGFILCSLFVIAVGLVCYLTVGKEERAHALRRRAERKQEEKPTISQLCQQVTSTNDAITSMAQDYIMSLGDNEANREACARLEKNKEINHVSCS